jgi:hypothetical protein
LSRILRFIKVYGVFLVQGKPYSEGLTEAFGDVLPAGKVCQQPMFSLIDSGYNLTLSMFRAGVDYVVAV